LKIAATITLNGGTIPIELDVADAILAPPSPFLDDAALRRRWHSSARTLGRIRKGGLIAFTQPTAGKYLYRVEDVERFEAAERTEVRPIVRVAARRSA
jgi:hypothetical protein